MLKIRQLPLVICKRWKHRKDHWSMVDKKTFPKDRALQNFDDFYRSVYGLRWNSMRVALLTEHKYIALVNNFGDTEYVSEKLQLNGCINVRELFETTRRRLESENISLFPKENSYKLSERLSGFIKSQEQQEIASIYPQDSNSAPSSINTKSAETKIDDPKNKQKPVDFKKSLHNVTQEDAEIDLHRLVDPEFGEGALYEYIPTSRIKGMEDWVPESEHYKYYSDSTTDFPLSMELEKDFEFPEHLQIYTYEKGNCSRFISPKKCETGVYSHYLMNGSSILPPLFLNIAKGERVLDACAAPGGKSLVMLQTLHPDFLVCNDIMESRTNRIKNIMYQFVCDFDKNWSGKRCLITQGDARFIADYNCYDKILVDVPCTTDRHAVMENDNNIFRPTRIKERLRIPELQSDILANCLRLLKPGGSLVYSTCSLSPIQNDGVVHMALKNVFTEFGITATIKDLSLLAQGFSDIFKFEHPKGLKYGQMVIPYLPANFGPLYFSKITRNLE